MFCGPIILSQLNCIIENIQVTPAESTRTFI
jgi:hypothetical protein